MPTPATSFRDFGISPHDLPPPPQHVHAYFSRGRAIGQYIFTGLVALVGFGLIALFVSLTPTPVNLLGCAAVIAAFGCVIYLVTRHDYGEIDLDGSLLTARHLYTGRTIQRPVSDIESLRTIVHAGVNLSTTIAQKLLGRVKGVEVRFKDGTKFLITRADPAMTNAQPMIEAILARMAQHGKLDADVVDFQGQPLVRAVVWRGERPTLETGKPNPAKIVLGCLMFLTLLFGMICTFIWVESKSDFAIGSVPPQQIPLATLIEKGPGANRHVVVTDFQPGGYAFETKSESWTGVWLALFPPGDRHLKIQAVYSSSRIRNEPELRRIVAAGRLKGICSATPRTGWGTTLGPNIVKSNQNIPLDAVWDIREFRELPSESTIFYSWLGGIGCLAATILFAGLVVWLR